MAASTKVQLGARVSPGVREAAVARAKSERVSLNVWVERTLGAALSEAKGAVSREQAVPGPVGSEVGQLPAVDEPVRTAAPRRAPAKQPAPGTSWAERMAAQAIKNEADRQKAAKRR